MPLDYEQIGEYAFSYLFSGRIEVSVILKGEQTNKQGEALRRNARRNEDTHIWMISLEHVR